MEATQLECGYDSGQDPQMPITESHPTTTSEYLTPMVDRTFRFVDERFVKQFDSNEDLREFLSKIETRNGYHNFKILQLTCTTVEASFHLMLAEWFNSGFKRASHWFLILMDVQGVFEDINTKDLRSLQSALSSSKPLVIQWTFRNSNKCCIFYKPSNGVDLIPLNQVMGTELTEEELIEELTPEGSFSLPLLLKALSHGLGGFFAGDLSKIAFDVESEFDGWRLLDYATRDDDDLSLRFLKLVEWDLTAISGEQRVLEIAAKYSSPQSISALLDQPIIGTKVEPSLSISQKDLLKLVDVSNNTPLTIAIEEGGVDTMEYLILCGADINHRKKMQWNYLTPIQLAWNNKFYDKVLILLEADSPFPDEYHLDDLDDSEIIVKLKELTDIRRKFHENIIDKDEDKVNDFIRDYPRLKHAYNSDNQTALVTALKSKAYEMFALLESKKFLASKSEDLAALKERLSEQENNELKEAKHRYFGRVKDAHIINLLSKWRTHGVENGDRSVLVRDLFERLDQIPEVSTVLKVVEHAEALEIIFDFDNDSIVDLDPTQAESTSGSCDYKMGRLYVGAKQPLEALGTLAHELTHLAMQTVFDNNCNPYIMSDEDTKSSFGEIVEKYRNLEGLDPIIARVFTAYRKYPKQWPSELIVRVPHLLAIHHKHKDDHQMLEKLREGALELFSFYSKNVQRQFEEFIKNPGRFKARIKLRRLNDLLGQLQAMEESKIRLQSPSLLKDNEIDFNTISVLSSDLPQLTKSDLYQTLKRKESNLQDKFIFTGIDQFANDKQAEEIYDAFQSAIKPILIVDCSRDYDLHHFCLWETICSFSEKRRIILIARLETGTSIRNTPGRFKKRLIEKEYNWMDLKIESQKILLEQLMDFQGYPIALNKLVECNSSLLNAIPLQNLLQKVQIKIGKPIPLSYGYDEQLYIERRLEKWLNNTTKCGFPEPDLYYQKLVLICDAAGTGKSTLLTHFSIRIKGRDPSFWVLKYDLSSHMTLLEEQRNERLVPLDFVRRKLLDLQAPFEKALFEENLARNKIVLMLDGFDEISPRYKDVLLELIEAFHRSPIKQLWIASRSHLREDLQSKLCGTSYVLQPFTYENQVEFLMRIWANILNEKWENLSISRIDIYASELLDRISRAIRDNKNQITGIPLLIDILAKAFEKEFKEFYRLKRVEPNLPTQLDILEVYEKFLNRKYSIYSSEKNNDLTDVLKSGMNFRKIHQQLALESIFPEQKQDLLRSKKNHALNTEELQRIGLVQYIEDKPRFIHRTFSEYYVIDFLVCQMRKTNEYVRDFLLKEILMEARHDVMRVFLDSLLKKVITTLKLETFNWYGQGIVELWKEGLLRNSEGTILHNAVAEGNQNIITFMLESLKAVEGNKSTLREMLSARNNEREDLTTWHLTALKGNSFLFPKLHEWAKEAGLSHEDLKTVMLSNARDRNILHSVAYYSNSKISTDIYNFAKDMLSKQEFKSLLLCEDILGQTAWGLAAMSAREGFFTSVLEMASELLDVVDFKNMMLKYDGLDETPWHKAAEFGDLQAFEWFFAWSKVNLSADDIKTSLLRPNNSIWPNLACRNSIEILESFRKWSEAIDLDFVNDVLLSRDNLEQAWHKVAQTGDLVVLQKLVEYCQEYEVNLPDQVILSKSEYNCTIWQIAALHGHAHILEYLLEISKNLQLDLKSELFLRKDVKGRNSFHLAAHNGKSTTLKKLWELAKTENFTYGELTSLISEKDVDGDSAWHQLYPLCLKMLWDFALEIGLDPKGELLMCKGSRNQTLWHMAAFRDASKVLEELYKLGESIDLKPEEYRHIFLEKDSHGKTVWHITSQVASVELVGTLRRFCKELGIKIKEDLLFTKDNDGKTIWHSIAEKTYISIMERFHQFVSEEDLTAAEFMGVLLSEDNIGNTVWHLIADGDPVYLKNLWSLAKTSKLSPEDFKELLYHQDKFGNTVWHKVLKSKKVAELKDLFVWGVEILDPQGLYRLLTLTNADAKTIWHVSAESGAVETMKILLDNSKAKLDQQSLCETMEVVARGETALSLAVTGRHVETVKFLLEIGSDSFARKWYDEILKQAVLIGDQDVTSVILDEIQKRSLNSQ